MSRTTRPRRDRDPAGHRRGRHGALGAACLAGVIVGAGLWSPVDAHGQQADAEVMRILSEMAAQGTRFQPAGLRALGRPGLSAVLDHLLPDTAEPESTRAARETVARLIAQLGHDDFRVREAATAALTEFGPLAKPALLEATRNADAEISWRAVRILKKWNTVQGRDERKLVDAFAVYLHQLNDADCFQELARRVKLALDGTAPDGARHQLLSHCLMAIGRSGRDEYSDVLKPLLKHENVYVAGLVTEMVGSAADNFPPLLLDALRSDREKVVTAAIKCVPNCRREPRRAEVRRLLLSLFEGDNEPLKFQACLPLTQGFNHPQAAEYLLAQAGSKDPQRRARAIAWIGDPSNRGRPASPELLKTLRPLLESKDYKIRREAMRALAVYSGENVVHALLPLLNDPKAVIATEVSFRLLQQDDKQMLRRLLAAAAKDGADEKIRQKAVLIIGQLDKRQ